MKKDIFMFLILEIIVVLIFLIISILFCNSEFNEFIYKFILPIIVAIIPLAFAWVKDRELKIREEKVKNYNQFLDALTIKLSNMHDKNKMQNENFCKEANRLALYASNDVIEYVNDIAERRKNTTNELLQRIRKDLINTNFEYSDKVELMFHIDAK